ncbi:ABC transporter permease [Pseudoclavibacter sp. RFBB5]|uniref:ABC transporter permease n=1 Tax=Pseudoclavibacter sp. RFBB5 TaxID=2080574 RepID=UPI000CE8AE79|nr:ABC transporter permease [Pseudoclavibacter sp. RFBB5]PPG31223.1 ABC transporter permease [Pseudoclavibacter sp. RFBB5]
MATSALLLPLDQPSPQALRAAAARRIWSKLWPPLLLSVAVIALWEIAVIVFGVSSFIIAKPSDIATTLFTSSEMLLEATWITTQEVLWGFLISIIVGIAIALVVVRYAWIERAVYPLIVLFQVVPKVALAPIFILWFGYSMTPKLVLIVVMAFFPITINMVLGLKRTDDDLILLMRSVGSTRNQIMTRVQVPNSLPYLFTGMRIAITLAVIGAVVAEFAGSQNGLGYLIQFASTQLDTALMFAALIVVSLLGLAFYYLVGLAEYLASKRFPHITIDER